MQMAGLYHTVILVLCSTIVTSTVSEECEDIEIRSDAGKKGNFSSPSYPQNYADGLKCLIKFVGDLDERVQITFTDFTVDGFPNELAGVSTGCTNDFVDIYTQLEHPDHDIISQATRPGRYCGNDLSRLPHLFMSRNRTLVITFDSDKDGQTARGFFGHYEFISNEPYKMGTPALYGCGWTMNGTVKPVGYIVAPYYPAVYPDNLDCYFLLSGQPGQRIKLEFIDFDLYNGGEHCPYDNVAVYDGGSQNSSTKIGTYCSKLTGLVIYSTYHLMYLRFTTRSGRPHINYQYGDDVIYMSGFKAKYTFSNEFVNLDFIGEGGKHMTGTECDVRIKSKGASSGEIVSPNFPRPSPPNTTCHYYIDGLIDQDHLEKVSLTFEDANLPAESGISCGQNDVYIATYLYGQTPTSERSDSFLCDRNLPGRLTSSDPRLTLRYTTGDIKSGAVVGFKAKYQFKMDFAIDGTPASPTASADCHFIYRSTSEQNGKLNSPRYPSDYPNDITCTYELIAQRYEVIMISFDTFNVEQIGHGVGDCLGDSISAVSVIPQADNSTIRLPMGKYCGTAYPGPLVSEWQTERMVLTFKSDSEVSRRGFKAKYEFIPSPERFLCGGNITKGGSGEILPPDYPEKYQIRTVCDWYIYRHNPQAQIKIKFELFDIEGTMQEGCQGAVLRIYKSEDYKVDYEICGQVAPVDNIISEHGFIRIKFISSSKAFGKTGFKISWTEVIEETENCPWFQCADQQLCVPVTTLCNGRNDCIDGSDELGCATNKLSHVKILYIITGVVIAVLIIILVTVCVCIKCTVKKGINRSASSRKTSSRPSDSHIAIDTDLVCHDRLSKAPMLPHSQSTNSSTFSPYDQQQIGNRYSTQNLVPNQYEPASLDHPPAFSTLSSKYSYNPSLQTSLHRLPGDNRYNPHSPPNRYDMDSCLTSL